MDFIVIILFLAPHSQLQTEMFMLLSTNTAKSSVYLPPKHIDFCHSNFNTGSNKRNHPLTIKMYSHLG